LVKTEWGIKRECAGCGTRFYDLGHDPIVCPKCEEIFTPESAKLTRAEVRAIAKAVAVVTKSTDDDAAALLVAEGLAGDDNDDDDDDEEDAGLIEGGFDVEGEDDVSDVVVAPTATKTEDT